MNIQEEVNLLNTTLQKIQEYKQSHPEARCGYHLTYRSLLNAYREGDIAFEDCVAEMKKIGVAEAVAAEREACIEIMEQKAMPLAGYMGKYAPVQTTVAAIRARGDNQP